MYEPQPTPAALSESQPNQPAVAQLSTDPAVRRRPFPQRVRYAVIDAKPTPASSTQLVIMRGWQEPNAYAITQPLPTPRRSVSTPRSYQRLHRVLTWLFLLALVGIGLLIGIRFYRATTTELALGQPAVATNLSAATVNTGTIATTDDTVIARAIVKPVRYAQLGFSLGGRVKERLVQEGDRVEAGQALLRLDDTRQLVAIAQARAGLQQAEAQLAGLRTGARIQEIAAAEAVVQEAQARLTTLQQASVQTADEAAAQATLAAAQAKLEQLQAGPTEASLISVRAEMQQAAATLQSAQRAYDQVSWRNDVGMLPEAHQLQQATIAYEAAKARYDQRFVQADNAQVSAVYAEIESAKANLTRLRAPAKAGELEMANAQLRQAQAELDLLNAGAPTATIAAAEAAVTAAQATLMAAEADLAETVLRAPFAGTVAAIQGEVGEQLQARAPILQLGDLSGWQIETDDLVELDVVKVHAGVPATITIDALPGVELTGQVVRIRPIGENKIGDMTYTAYLQLDETHRELAWNMTATVYLNETVVP